jgi:hypothetical protein
MKRKSGSEMNKLLWSFTIPVLLLVAVIVGFYLVVGIVNANSNAKHTRELLINQTVDSYKRIGENFQNMNINMEALRLFNPEILRAVMAGEAAPLYGLVTNMMTIASPAEYVAVIQDGQVKQQTSTLGASVDASQLPTSPPPGDRKLLDSFNGKKGTYVNVFYPIDVAKVGMKLPKFHMSALFNVTTQVNAIDKYFNDQKKKTIIALGITAVVALILFALLSTFWLRYLINKYIRRPVEELNAMAEGIAAGTFQGEVVVDHDSDFAALQGLLKSGQLILRKFNQEM